MRSGGRVRGAGAQAAIMLGTTVAVSAAMAGAGMVPDLGALGGLYSIFGVLIAVGIFWVARRLCQRVFRSKVDSARRRDLQNRGLVVSAINLCRSLALGAEGSGRAPAVSAMRHVAERIGEVRAVHGYLLTDAGRQAAEAIRDSALSAIVRQSCAPAELADIVQDLARLGGEILDVDDGALARRRASEAGVGDPVAE